MLEGILEIEQYFEKYPPVFKGNTLVFMEVCRAPSDLHNQVVEIGNNVGGGFI